MVERISILEEKIRMRFRYFSAGMTFADGPRNAPPVEIVFFQAASENLRYFRERKN